MFSNLLTAAPLLLSLLTIIPLLIHPLELKKAVLTYINELEIYANEARAALAHNTQRHRDNIDFLAREKKWSEKRVKKEHADFEEKIKDSVPTLEDAINSQRINVDLIPRIKKTIIFVSIIAALALGAGIAALIFGSSLLITVPASLVLMSLAAFSNYRLSRYESTTEKKLVPEVDASTVENVLSDINQMMIAEEEAVRAKVHQMLTQTENIIKYPAFSDPGVPESRELAVALGTAAKYRKLLPGSYHDYEKAVVRLREAYTTAEMTAQALLTSKMETKDAKRFESAKLWFNQLEGMPADNPQYSVLVSRINNVLTQPLTNSDESIKDRSAKILGDANFSIESLEIQLSGRPISAAITA